MKIVIVDYGMGNIKSISATLRFLGVDQIVLSADFDELQQADKIILPGVGSFAKAMSQIRKKGLDKMLKQLILTEKKPLLGICLGMQLLGVSSSEDGFTEGLSFVNGTVTRFAIGNLKIPHVGFNQVNPSATAKLFSGLSESPDFYFTHSFKMLSDQNINQSSTHYGENFIAAFEIENIAGVQFHPELSQTNGLKLLKNFIEKF